MSDFHPMDLAFLDLEVAPDVNRREFLRFTLYSTAGVPAPKSTAIDAPSTTTSSPRSSTSSVRSPIVT